MSVSSIRDSQPKLVSYQDLYPEMNNENKVSANGNVNEAWTNNSDSIPSSKGPANGMHPIQISSDPVVSNGNKVQPHDTTVNGKTEKTSEKKEKMKLVSTLQLFRFADKLDVLFMVIGTICSCIQGAALPVLLLAFGDMTDSFVKAGTPGSNSSSTTANPAAFFDVFDKEIQKSSYIYSGLGFGVLVACYIRVTLCLHASLRQTQRIRVELFRAVLRQEIGWFDTNKAGELGTRLADDINKIQEGIGDKIANFFQWFSTFLTGIIIGLVKGWKLALVILSVSPLLAIGGGMMTLLITSTTSKELGAYAKAGAVAEEVLSSIRTVVAFGGQSKECIRYSKNLTEAKAFGIRKSFIAGFGMGITFLIIFLTYALAFWYGGKLTREEKDHYTIGVMLIVFFCVIIGAFALGNAMPNLENIGAARGAAFVIWNIIDRKSAIDSSSDEGLKPSSLTGNIEFKDVVFRYPSRPDVPVANGLNIRVMKGQTVALVGASGCGKSTVVQLLQRFYDPLSGTVCIDGVDTRELSVKWLRRNIGIVSQEPILFATTIGENIRYGRDDVTQDEIEKAAMEANAHSFISKLPMKYDTLVGERGAQLSGGQKQRIAIARALVRNPRILLLDEATSALDTESEATVQSALDKARLGRTTIVIAHRLSTIKTADIIYGIKEGVVAESGTHAELMQLGGIYFQLVTNQQLVVEAEEGHAEVDMAGSPAKFERALSRSSVRGTNSVDVVPDTEVIVSSKKEENLEEASVLRIMSINAPEWPFMFVGCIAAIVQGGVQPVFAIIFSTIIGVFGNPDLDYQAERIFFYSMMFIVIGAGSAVAMLFQAWMFGISGERLTMRIRQMTFRALLRQEIAFYDDHNNSTGALATRLSTDASAMQGATGVRLGMAFQSFASIGTGIIIGFVFSWKLTLFIIGFVPLFLIAGVLQMKAIKGFSGTSNEVLEQAGKVANEAIVNIRTVASLTKEPKFVDDYRALTDIPHRQNMKKSHVSAVTFAFSQSLIFFAYAAIFTFGAWLIKNDGLAFESMFKVFSAVVFGAMAVGQASSFAPDYGKAKISAARVFHLIDQQPAIDSYSTDGVKPAVCNGTVQFHGVHFSYPTRKTVPVLKGLTFSVEQGSTIALVGSSGCGKSTTVQLLERFYDTANGEVSIDGVDVKQLSIEWLRSQIGIVSQEPILFDCSIAENIAYGDNSRDIPMDEIITAARKANIHNFIIELPDSYQTNVGAKGTQLSGGQKQRIAIARALVRNPKILLLDEATSALDTESEKVVQEALDQAQIGRTSLVIAHRLSTIQNATCIIVIHQGCVAESGTHAQLMTQRGLYYRLHLAQASRR